MSDGDFEERLADRLLELPGIQAVALGGSRARGIARADSDWDFGIYYRRDFDPQSLRDVGWPGEVSEVGEWGGGVFNGGAWLEVEGRRVDVHYRDLDSVEHELSEAEAGRFRIEALMFHLAGIPSYIVVAELALHQPLRGNLPHPAYPSALKARAPEVWWQRAERLFAYAGDSYAPRGRLAPCVGLVVQAASCVAHAVLARSGEWVTNEKTLLTRAGLDDLDGILTSAEPHDVQLALVVARARELGGTPEVPICARRAHATAVLLARGSALVYVRRDPCDHSAFRSMADAEAADALQSAGEACRGFTADQLEVENCHERLSAWGRALTLGSTSSKQCSGRRGSRTSSGLAVSQESVVR